MTIEWQRVGDEETIERRAVMIATGRIIDAAGEPAQRQRHLSSAMPVVATLAPFLRSSYRDLWRLAIIKVDMRIALQRAIRRGEVDYGAHQFTAPPHVQKRHILPGLRLRDARIGGMNGAPPLLGIRKWLITHIPGNIIQRVIGEDSDTSLGGKRHRPVEIEVH